MEQTPGGSTSGAVLPSGTGGHRRGTCRLCFDEGGDLVAPCLCKGTSRWIHRECLNLWRVNGSNPRAMTNCCECGFQYHMVLHRAKDTDIDNRQREFLHQMGAQSAMAFMGIQVAITALGMMIRAFDKQEVLVKTFKFPQEPGQTVPGDFWNAMNHHKSTYYLAGFLALAAAVGLLSVIYWLISACNGRTVCPSSGGSTPMDMYTGYACGRCCDDCCMACCRCDTCCRGPGSCCNCPMSGASGMDMSSGGESAGACAVCCLVILVVLIFVGIFMALAAVVWAIQENCKKYAQVQQMRMLAGEYQVEDLARDEPDTEEVGMTSGTEPQVIMTGAARLPARTDEHETASQQMVQDLEGIFGRSGERPHVQTYGSV